MTVRTCPSRDTLTDYLLGRGAKETLEAVGSHVETCGDCQAALEELDTVADDLLANLQSSTDDPFADEPECRAMVERIHRELSCGMAEPGSRQETGGRIGSMDLGEAGGRIGRVDSIGVVRDYVLLKELGRGGMGTVYKAQHKRLKRIVALKVLAAERMTDRHAVDRFEREMEAVGKLEHPNIVRAMDAGEQDGMHYLVMEYVEGVDVSELVHCCGPLPIADACEIIRQTALGLQHAHEHGLVHRDIKPSNLMLSVERISVRPSSQPDSLETRPTVKILDLGLALLGGRESHLTTTGQLMGTVDYIAPEQVTDSHAVDARADIYSLGCTFYRLLTGRAPFADPKYANHYQKMRAHVEATPAPIGDLRPDVPYTLVRLLSRMMAKKPEKRLATAAEVADALAPLSQGHQLPLLLEQFEQQRDLSIRELSAIGPDSSAETVPQLGGAETSSSGALSARSPRWWASAPQRLSRMIGLRHWWNSLPDAEDSALPVTVHPTVSGRRRLSITLNVAVGLFVLLMLAGVVVVIKDRHDRVIARIDVPQDATVSVQSDGLPEATEPPARNDASGRMNERPGRGPSAEAEEPPVAFPASTDSEYEQRAARLWLDAELPDNLVAILGDSRLLHWAPLEFDPVAYTPDGGAIVSAGRDHAICVWDAATGRLERILGRHPAPIFAVDVDPTGTYVASFDQSGGVRLWRFRDGTLIHQFEVEAGDEREINFSPDGRMLAVSAGLSNVWLYEMPRGPLRKLSTGDEVDLRHVAFSADGRRLATCTGSTLMIKIWDARSLQLLQTLRHDAGEFINTVAFHPNGRYLASGAWTNNQRSLRIWDLQSGRTVFAQPWQAGSVLYSRDGRWLAVAGEHREVQLRDPVRGEVLHRGSTHSPQWGLAFSPDLKRLVSGARFQHAINVWAVPTMNRLNARLAHPATLRSIVFGRPGRWLYTADADGKIVYWDIAQLLADEDRPADEQPGQTARAPDTAGPPSTAQSIRLSLREHADLIGDLAVSPNGTLLASASLDGYVQVTDARSGKTRLRLNHPAARAVAFHPTATLLATAGGDGIVRLWGYEDGRPLGFEMKHDGRVLSVAFSPDGKRLAAGGTDKQVRFWDVATNQLLATVDDLPQDVQALAFSPDGKRLAVACHRDQMWHFPYEGGPGRLVVLDGRSGKRLIEHALPAMSVAFSPDGRLLAASDSNGRVTLLDAESGAVEHQWRLGPADGFIRDLAFSPDGRYLATANGNGTVYVLSLPAAEGRPAE